MIMVTLIWLTWLINIFFLCVILLNFLIAIISESYEFVLSTSQQNMYIHRAVLNRECRVMKKSELVPLEVLIYTVVKEDEE